MDHEVGDCPPLSRTVPDLHLSVYRFHPWGCCMAAWQGHGLLRTLAPPQQGRPASLILRFLSWYTARPPRVGRCHVGSACGGNTDQRGGSGGIRSPRRVGGGAGGRGGDEHAREPASRVGEAPSRRTCDCVSTSASGAPCHLARIASPTPHRASKAARYGLRSQCARRSYEGVVHRVTTYCSACRAFYCEQRARLLRRGALSGWRASSRRRAQ